MKHEVWRSKVRATGAGLVLSGGAVDLGKCEGFAPGAPGR